MRRQISRAVDGMARSRRWMQGGGVAPDDERQEVEATSDDHVRVDVGAAARQVRITDAPSDSATLEDEAEAHDREQPGKRPA